MSGLIVAVAILQASADPLLTAQGPQLSELTQTLGKQAAQDAAARPEIVKRLGDALSATTDFERRVRIARALGMTGDPAALAALSPLLKVDDDVVRWEATKALATLPGSLASLREALRDASPRVRDAAVTGLSAHRDAAPALVETLKHDRWMFVRRDAADALGAQCTPPALSALRAAAGSKEEDEDVRRAAMAAMVRCKDRDATPVLLAALRGEDEDRELREKACTLLGASGDRRAAPDIMAFLKKARSEGGDFLALGVACTRALGPLAAGDPAAERLLVDQLGDAGQPPLQIAAAEALGHVCTPGARKALEKAAADKSPLLRRAAKDALDRCFPQTVQAPVMK